MGSLKALASQLSGVTVLSWVALYPFPKFPHSLLNDALGFFEQLAFPTFFANNCLRQHMSDSVITHWSHDFLHLPYLETVSSRWQHSNLEVAEEWSSSESLLLISRELLLISREPLA